MGHGTTFNWEAIRAELETAEWQADEEPGREIKLVWLGSVFGLTPSGKIYQPFACSNVAGDCPVCKGEGKREPRTGRRIRKRAARRQRDFARGTIARGMAQSPAGAAYVQRVAKYRAAAFRRTNLGCAACDGQGSISAARDERWTERLEADAEAIGAFVHYFDDGIFIAQSRDVEEGEASDDE